MSHASQFAQSCLGSLRARMKSALLGLTVAASVVGFSAPAVAANGFVTKNETAIQTIYSTLGYTFDFVFLSTKTLEDASFLNISGNSTVGDREFATLARNAITLPGVINLFFVDTIDYCGGYNTSIVGCAFSPPGNSVIVESSWAAGDLGSNLLAHEIAHNLGLGHDESAGNLMNGTLSLTANQLSASQLNTISHSSLVSLVGGVYTITVNPIMVVAAVTAVPEPETWLMFTVGLVGLVGVARHRQSRA